MTTEAIQTAGAAAEAPERVYIFCPEEPFLQVYVNGRMLSFANGRLVSTHLQNGRPMTEEDIAFFEQQNTMTGGPPKYVIWRGDIAKPEQRGMLMMYLQERVTRQVITRAQGVDASTLAQDITLAMAMMLSTDDGLPDLYGQRNGSGQLDMIARLQPGLAAQMKGVSDFAMNAFGGGINDLAAARRDDEMIRKAAAGETDELAPPAAKNVDELQPGGGQAVAASPWE